jgi:DNA repair protein RadA/Sms
VLSSCFDLVIPSDCCFAGEVGLSGEIRPVSQVDRRITEAARLGFKTIYISEFASTDAAGGNIRVVKVADVPALVKKLFRS